MFKALFCHPSRDALYGFQVPFNREDVALQLKLLHVYF